MENVESIEKSNESEGKVTRAQFGEKFALLREEATECAIQYRQRLQKAATASALSGASTNPVRTRPQPLRAEPQDRNSSPPCPSPIASPVKDESRTGQPRVPQNFDLIALWSVVGPSTITAVFAGVAMSSSHVPLPYAIAFIFAWFTLTSALAVGVLKLFNTKECATLLRASGSRLGIAAVSCALIAVLTVEAARLSITAMAGPAPRQVGSKQIIVTSPVHSALSGKTSARTAARERRVASAQSVHYLSTPNVISAARKAPKQIVSESEMVTSLPKPNLQTSADADQTSGFAAASASALPRPPRRTKDVLLGSISAKGKFLPHRSSSRWTGGTSKTAAKRGGPASDKRNILERIFNPIINTANAKAPSGRVGTSSEDLAGISR